MAKKNITDQMTAKLNTWKTSLMRNLSNLPGWRSKRRIVVIESDDWGSIRMPSKEAYSQLMMQGVRVDRNYCTRYDSLERNDDLAALYEVLSSFQDKNGNHPAFTALCIMANPDFDKIREDDFQAYHYEPFTETLKRYGPEHQQVLQLWREGLSKNLFRPQFHGREHLNVHAWMHGLKAGWKVTRLAFELGLTGIPPAIAGEDRMEYQAAFNLSHPKEKEYLRQVIREGTQLFEKFLGYRASFFVPTNGYLNNELEPTLKECGIRYLNSRKIQEEPLGEGKYRKNFRYLGKKNKLGQAYLTRNAFFEPSKPSRADWVGSCLQEIQIAFKWQKPAVISSHRANYTGRIEPGNRDRGLSLLRELLASVLKQWPDVEFMTSDQLGRLITNTQQNNLKKS